MLCSRKRSFGLCFRSRFPKEDLLTDKARKNGKSGKDSQYKPIINVENHDTIGLLALDKNGDISGLVLLGAFL